MNGPDVPWECVSHNQIVDWTSKGPGAAVTEALEARLKSVAEVLNANSDLIHATLQRVNGGEWTGNAAAVATQAMRVLRDFDDILGHHGEANVLAAYGQSDNASWVRASVPEVVDVRAAQVPTGGPIDVLNSTVDHYHQQRLAKDAEEKARQVMREYEIMTTERVGALPPLSPAPQVAIGGGDDMIPAGPGDAGAPDEDAPPRGGRPDGGDDAPPRSDGRADGGPPAPRADDSPDRSPSGADPVDPHGDRSRTDPSGASAARPLVTPPVDLGAPIEAARPVGGFGGVGDPRFAGPLPGGIGAGQPAGPREPGSRGGQPGTGSRGATEMHGRARQGGSAGVAPVSATGPRQSTEEKEHQVRYGVPGSGIFEPDNDNGLLHDPYRPGSFVAPASIGDDDDK